MARVGFDYASLETEFASDPKFQRLRRISGGNPIAYHAAVGVWLQIVADTWHAADRFAGTESAANLPVELVEMLVKAGLLDTAHCISESAFDQWVGEALKRRRDVAARVRRYRERHRDVPVTEAPIEIETGVGNGNVTQWYREGQGEGISSREEKKNVRDEVSGSAEDYDRAWFATLRDLYGPGGIFDGRPLPGKFQGKTWAEVEAGLA